MIIQHCIFVNDSINLEQMFLYDQPPHPSTEGGGESQVALDKMRKRRVRIIHQQLIRFHKSNSKTIFIF
jgi:hypothetical protein